jgi:peptidoglycan/LPS O-acetylase OafA/YrhL
VSTIAWLCFSLAVVYTVGSIVILVWESNDRRRYPTTERWDARSSPLRDEVAIERGARRAEPGLHGGVVTHDRGERDLASRPWADRRPARSLVYVPELTGLRGVAIGMVLLAHSDTRFPGGFMGVDIFFVLSGYLITTLLVQEFHRWGDVKLTHFYARRLVRLGPALGILLALYALFALAASDNAREHVIAALTAATYTMDWTQALNLGPDGFLLHTWSLGVEEQFYLLWPVILIAALRYGVTAWKVIVGLIIAVTIWRGYLVLHTGHNDPERTYVSFDTRFDTLLVGCLLAVAPLQWARRLATRFPTIPLLIFAMLTLAFAWTSSTMHLVGFPLIAALAGWLTLGAMTGNYDALVRRFLRWSPVEYLGRISYGVYLWHLPIALALSAQLPKQWLQAFALTCVLTVSIAAASYHWVERPILNRWRFTRPRPTRAEANIAGITRDTRDVAVR